MTAVAGVFFAFYYNNLFPEQVFNISRSIEIILGPIIGGIGTLFGPIIGAFLLTGLSEASDRAAERARLRHRPAPSRCSTASACWSWSWCCRTASGRGSRARSASTGAAAMTRAARGRRRQQELPRAARGRRRELRRWRRATIFAVIGPNGAGKTTLFNMIAGVLAPDDGTIAFRGRAHRRAARPDEVCRRGIGRTFQIVRPFPALTRRGQRHGRRAAAPAGRRRGARAAPTRCCARLDLFDKRAQPASALTLPDRKRLEVARALATDPKLLLLDEVMAGPAPDRDRPHGRDPAQAQPRERPDHPADRARHARGDGARRRACWCCITARRSPRARRRRWCASRR